jgi:hypothetical protein
MIVNLAPIRQGPTRNNGNTCESLKVSIEGKVPDKAGAGTKNTTKHKVHDEFLSQHCVFVARSGRRACPGFVGVLSGHQTRQEYCNPAF